MSNQFEFTDAGRTITLVPQGNTVEAVWSRRTSTGIAGIAAQAIKALLAKIAELESTKRAALTPEEAFDETVLALRNAEIARLTAEVARLEKLCVDKVYEDEQHREPLTERAERAENARNVYRRAFEDAVKTYRDAQAALAEHRNELVGLAGQTEAEIFAESTAKELAGHITAYIQQQNGEIHDLETERDELTHRLAAYETPQPEQPADEAVRRLYYALNGCAFELQRKDKQDTFRAAVTPFLRTQQPRRVSRERLRELEITYFNPNWRGGALRDALVAVLRELGIDVEGGES